MAAESSVDQAAALVDSNTSVVTTDDVIDTWVDVWTAQNHLAHLFSVSRCDTDWHGQFLCNLGWHTNFVDTEVWIWGDHRSGTEVDTLTGQVATESAFLTLQSLSERLEGSTRSVTCWWNSGGLVVEVGGHVVLEKFPKVLNDQLWSTGVTVFTKSLVDSQNVNELVRQIVFRAISTVEGDRRTDGDWRHGEHLQHNPFWTVLLVHSNEDQIFGWNLPKPFTDVTSVELAPSLVFSALTLGVFLFLEGRRLVQSNLALSLTTVHTNTTA